MNIMSKEILPSEYVSFMHMLISGSLKGTGFLTFLLPSREDLGIYPEKHPSIRSRVWSRT